MSKNIKRETSEQETFDTQDEDKDHSTVFQVDPQSRKSVRRSVLLQRQDAVQHDESSESEDEDFDSYMKILNKEKNEWSEEYRKRKSEFSQVNKQLQSPKLDPAETDQNVKNILDESFDFEEFEKKQTELRANMIKLKMLTRKSENRRDQLFNYAKQQAEQIEKRCIEKL